MELAELLDVRLLQHQGSKEIEVLIQWKGLQQSEATWEDMDMLIQRFLAFHLEDKVNLWGRGNVINPYEEPTLCNEWGILIYNLQADPVMGQEVVISTWVVA